MKFFKIFFVFVFSFLFFANKTIASSDDVLVNNFDKYLYDDGLMICASSTLSIADNNQGVFIKYNFDEDINLNSVNFQQQRAGTWNSLNIRYKLDIKESTSTSANIICETVSETYNYSAVYAGLIKSFYFNPNTCLLNKNTDYWFNIKSDIDDNCVYSTKTLLMGFSNYFTTERDTDVWYYPFNTGIGILRNDLTPMLSIVKYSDIESGNCGDCICENGGGSSSATTSTSTIINAEFLDNQDIGKISSVSGIDDNGITYTIYNLPYFLFKFIFIILIFTFITSIILIILKIKK